MPTDFLLDDVQVPQSSGRDFLYELEPESLGQAAKLAIPRMGEDLYRAAFNAYQHSPEYWQAAKTEIPGMLNPLNFHPIARSKQLLAGLAELGHGVLNAPRGLADYAANRLNLIPQSWADKVPYQGDILQEVNQFAGTPQYPGDALARGLVRNTLNIIPAARIAEVINPLNLTAKSIANDVLKTRDKNIAHYGKRYEDLWKEAQNKGFDNALYNVNIDMNTLKKYSPNKSLKGLEDFDKDPTLENAHNAKSDLLRIERDLEKLTTLRTAERQQLAAAKNGIDSFKQNMFVDPNGQFHDAMKEKYNALQEGYRNEVVPYKNKAINEFLRNESSEKELVNALSKKAFYAKRGKYHSGMRTRKFINEHPNLARISAIGALGAGGLKFYKELFGKNN